MPQTISAEFETRRDAEMAVEHLVQEHGLDRRKVTIEPVSARNSAGTEAAGADLEDDRRKEETDGDPAIAGKLRVTAAVDDEALVSKVRSSFATYDGRSTTD